MKKRRFLTFFYWLLLIIFVAIVTPDMPMSIRTHGLWFFLLQMALGVIAVQIVLGPILAYFTLRYPVNAGFTMVAEDDEDLPPTMRKALTDATAEVVALGFEFVAFFKGSFRAGSQKVFITMLRHPTAFTWAACHSHVLKGVVTLKAHVVEFETRLQNGREIQTSRMKAVSPFHRLPHVIAVQFKSNERTLAELLDLHQAMIACFGESTAVDESNRDAAEYLNANWLETYEYQIKRGLHRRSADGRFFCPTVWGAMIMTWKLIWPFTIISRVLMSRRRRAMLRQLEQWRASAGLNRV